GAHLAGCQVDGYDALVTATVPLTGPFAGFGPATVRARAGPVQEVATATARVFGPESPTLGEFGEPDSTIPPSIRDCGSVLGARLRVDIEGRAVLGGVP